MKNFKRILIALGAMCVLSACGGSSSGDEPDPGPKPAEGTVVGSWHLLSWNTLSAADVYVSFDAAGRFDLYQRLYTPLYEHYTGSYTYIDGRLAGTYDDGEPWGGTYLVSFASGGQRMTLTRDTDAEDVALFGQASIPDEIRSEATSNPAACGLAAEAADAAASGSVAPGRGYRVL